MIPRVFIHPEKCVGCRTCEVICSYHHYRLFNPQKSSIKVYSDTMNGEVVISIQSTCDFCKNEKQPLCVEYCVYGALEAER